MIELLKKWATLERDLCQVESTTDWKNRVWQEVYVAGFMVVSDCLGATPDWYVPDRNKALMRIQWVVQEAIIARKWWFTLNYKETWGCILYYHNGQTSKCVTLIDQNSGAETLLVAYLKALQDS